MSRQLGCSGDIRLLFRTLGESGSCDQVRLIFIPRPFNILLTLQYPFLDDRNGIDQAVASTLNA
jgi:hypothetical protein